jgi:uncharacterized protein (TIGR02284 family)
MNRSDKVTVLTRAGSQAGQEVFKLSDDAGKLLHELYVQARDSAKGYREAAEASSGGAMKARLFGLARRRNAMAGQLEITMRSLGMEVETEGGIGDTLQHHFDELKAKLADSDVGGAISGIVRGEGAFMESIEKTLRQALPDGIKGFLERQQRQIRSAIDRFSSETVRESRLEAMKQKAREYRKPALIALLAVGAGALLAAAVVQQRRNGAVTNALIGARKALDKAMAQLPSARDVRGSLPHLPAVRLPEVDMPRLSGIRMPELRVPSFLRFR